MKLILTVGWNGEPGESADQLVEETVRLAGIVGASRASVEVGLTSEEASIPIPTVPPADPGVSAVMSFWEPSSPVRARDASWPAGLNLVSAYLADEVIQLDYERSWPGRAASPGIKQMVFLRRLPELDHGDFSEHWRDVHGPLAVRHHGFWRYVQDHVYDRLTGSSPLDGIAELHFLEPNDMIDRMYDSEEGMRLILDDVQSFVSLPDLTMLVTKEYLVP
jgi:uncharacterized protein (TIGR02118 family)